MSPIDAGHFTMADLRRRDEDGHPLVTLWDVCQANEHLIIKAENERKSIESMKGK